MKKSSLFVFALAAIISVPVVHATAGCNAIGWSEPHGMTGCQLYYPAVQWMYGEGIASGDATTGKFNPERNINRAEFTKLVLLASGVKNPPACTTAPFPDVPKSAWFAPYICAAKEKGIISGFPDGTFKPEINVNYANGAKILAKTFGIPLYPSDAQFNTEENIWYRPYTLGLLRKHAVAPSIRTFEQSLTRGEMAEMLYRLATGQNYFDNPIDTGEGDYLGYGYEPLELENALHVSLSKVVDAPYVYTKAERTVRGVFSKEATLRGGRAFSHVVQEENCGLSGLWQHCDPVYVDWTIEMYRTSSLSFMSELFHTDMHVERFFGGKRADCIGMGVEGDNIEFCIIPLGNKESFVVVREYVDSTEFGDSDVMPIEKSDAQYARIRGAIQFNDLPTAQENSNRFSSKFFTLSFDLPQGFEVKDGENMIRIAKAPFYSREIGDDNSFFRLRRFNEYDSRQDVESLYRELLQNQKETTVTIDGSKFLSLEGTDWGRFEGDSAGKVRLIFFEASWLEIIERPANATQDFAPHEVANEILASFSFSK